MRSLGEIGWRARVAAAPQFHQNHVLTESFAFNLLMSRAGRPVRGHRGGPRGVQGLGLGPLIDRMPGACSRWSADRLQLSHGEKSRLFHRARRCSSAATDHPRREPRRARPQNMAQALRCLGARVPRAGRHRAPLTAQRAVRVATAPRSSVGFGQRRDHRDRSIGRRLARLVINRAPPQQVVVDTLTRSEPSTKHITNSNSPALQVSR